MRNFFHLNNIWSVSWHLFGFQRYLLIHISHLSKDGYWVSLIIFNSWVIPLNWWSRICVNLSLIYHLIPLYYPWSILLLFIYIRQYHFLLYLPPYLILTLYLFHTSCVFLDLNGCRQPLSFEDMPKVHPIALFIVEPSEVFIWGVTSQVLSEVLSHHIVYVLIEV